MTTPAGNMNSRIRTLQIIAVALLLGASTFLGITIFLVQQRGGVGTQPVVVQGDGREQAPGQARGTGLPVVTLVAGLLLVMQVPMAFLLPRLTEQAALARLVPSAAGTPDSASDQERLLNIFQTGLILRLALLEGVAMLGAIAYLIEARLAALAIAAVALLLMLAFFPTEGGVTAWLRSRTAQLQNARLRRG